MSARSLAVALALLAAPAMAQAPLPGIVGADDRQIVEPREYPWSAIGRVNTAIGQRCSGTLVGPRLVATAAHCLWNKRTNRVLAPESVHFLAAYGQGAYVATARGVSIRRGTDGPPGDPAVDWALVTLAAPIGEQVGWIGMAPGEAGAAPRRGVVMRAGFGQDRPHLPMAVLGCGVKGTGSGGRIVVHDCDAVRGDSGAPMLLLDGGAVALIGIHVARGGQGGATVGLAVPAAAFAAAATSAGARASTPPPRGRGVDPVPSATVRALAARRSQPAPRPASLEALETLIRAR